MGVRLFEIAILIHLDHQIALIKDKI